MKSFLGPTVDKRAIQNQSGDHSDSSNPRQPKPVLETEIEIDEFGWPIIRMGRLITAEMLADVLDDSIHK